MAIVEQTVATLRQSAQGWLLLVRLLGRAGVELTLVVLLTFVALGVWVVGISMLVVRPSLAHGSILQVIVSSVLVVISVVVTGCYIPLEEDDADR